MQKKGWPENSWFLKYVELETFSLNFLLIQACQGLNLLMATSSKELTPFINSNFLIPISLQPDGLNLVE